MKNLDIRYHLVLFFEKDHVIVQYVELQNSAVLV